jgi:hypothetical protein
MSIATAPAPAATAAEYVEAGLIEFIRSLSAVNAIRPGIPVRVLKMWQRELPGVILIDPAREEYGNTLDGLGGVVAWTGNVIVSAETFDEVRLLLEAIRTNGTDPGSGLAGRAHSLGTFGIQMATMDNTLFQFVSYDDGSDEGYWFAQTAVSIDYQQST